MQRTVAAKFLVLASIVFLLIIAVIIIVMLMVVKKQQSDNGPSPTQPPAPAAVCYFNMQNPAWTTTYRLSNTTVPTLYVLSVQPFIEGNVIILRDAKYRWQPEPNTSQYWVVTLKNVINPGSYVLNLRFSGSLTKNIVGFYRSVYTNKLTGNQSQLATTKFEPTYARKAFPCFDEPNKKANYSIIIISDPSHPIVISNMPIQKSRVRADGWKVTTFQTSIKMSTYLVVFVISDFVSLSTKSQNAVTVSTYAPSDRINQTKYALQVAAQSLDFYDSYFGIPYNQSISKLDLVSIPDFISGAMENWGAVTFRETSILYDPNLASASAQERVAEVVVHELAHMWFGNLVTMDWWDDLWLNEGFATFMAYVKTLPAIKPQWNADAAFLIFELQDVLVLDGVASSHPIIQPVYRPDDINAAFDSITYGKGSSILRMLESYLGSSVFRKGIQAYLTKFQYSNAKTDDLWKTLQQISKQDVKTGMDKWTKQMGFPVVTWNSASKSVSQRKFFSNPKDAINSTSAGFQWYISLPYQTAAGVIGRAFLLPGKNLSLTLGPNLIGNWIKFNRQEKGYYRVNYDQTTWMALINQLITAPQVFNASDRAQLIDDSFNLAAATLLDYGTPLKLLQYLKRERQWVPWSSATSNLAYIDDMLRVSNQTTYLQFSKYIANFSSPVLVALGWNDTTDSNNLKRARSLVIGLSCGHGDTTCIGNAKKLFYSWLKDNSTWISPNYRKSVHKYGMQTLGSSQGVWNMVWSRYLYASPDTARDYQFALAQTNNTDLLKTYIRLAENKAFVRDQDYFIVMRYISANPVGTQIVYNYVKTNWNKLISRFTLNDRYFGRFIPAMTANFNTVQQLNDLRAFFAEHPEAGAGAGARKQAVADIQKNIEWTKVNVPKITTWLQQNAF